MRLLKLYSLLGITFFIVCTWGCHENHPDEEGATDAQAPGLFTILSPEKTNISFNNSLMESPYVNILVYHNFYHGGGVAIGDLNNDGLQDIYFSGNMVGNRLYLNKGKMQFQDITAHAGVAGKNNTWKTGTTIADVNGDGLLDIYQCYSGLLSEESRINQLFINQGPDQNGIPTFIDQAREYGLDDSAYSTHATFFDFDRDNDLDMFLLNHNPNPLNNLDDTTIKDILKKPNHEVHSKLYQNNGGKFIDISQKAGLANSSFSFGLGAGVSDINKDGWPDIYVSNDYSAPDYLLINNKDGTFTDQTKDGIGHTSLHSMGNDIADMNNNALPDIFTLDMLPEDNHRQKLLFAPDNYEYFEMLVRSGFHHQYMRNMLQVNNGNGTFSEVAQLSGISNTDWSWAPLLADYDNDGWKDVFVTNGYLKDFTNLDFLKFRSSYIQYLHGQPTAKSIKDLLDKMPSSNVTNYIYKNNGNLRFSNKTIDWGINKASNSNGAAYADLDNDGDLDLVTNNVNEVAFVYENQSEKVLKNQYLQLKLAGNGKNTAGMGAQITLYHAGKQQYQEQITSRGFQSSVSPVLHFGLGTIKTIDSLRVVWSSGKQQVLQKVKANQVLTLEEKNAGSVYKLPRSKSPAFTEAPSPVQFTHQKTPINDFKRQPLLINPLSFSGPCLVKADVNGDGLEDIFAGGAAGQAGSLYLQEKNGKFIQVSAAAFEEDKNAEDTDALFFDANNDNALDLYVASGGYHNFMPQDQGLQDRLYLNDGKGNFKKSPNSLPAMLSSTSCVRATDINGDGALDLFVGGRVIPGRYPEAPRSYVLLNNGKGQFTDNTAAVAPALKNPGMVTDAAWYDLNKDSKAELIVVGEWMPVTVFENNNGKLTDNTQAYFAKKYNGWWNNLTIGDFNQDNHPDLIIGNLGLNSQCKASDKEPAELYYKDFDDNGAVDPILCFYIQGKSYPYVTRDELFDQMSNMRTRFQDYSSYASATLEEIFKPEELKGAQHLFANYLKTAYFQGSSNGKFIEKPLPLQVQYAPVFATAVLDYNKDGAPDVLIGGNIDKARLRFGKTDANYGILLQGDGKGNFKYVPQNESGFQVFGDVRSILPVNNSVLFGLNQKSVKAYKIN